LAATHFVGARKDAQGRAQAIDVTLVTGPGNRNYLLQPAARDAAALRRAGAGLAEAAASFRALSPADRQTARPWTLQTVAYPRGGFADLARSSPLPAPAEAQLRLINGVYGGGAEPPPGQTVKVVR
jgi:predicted Zn-dependent protease